jgi:type II secretory ATPase GspE/PulE/Tfp pilus assembly ATPase PilB-like protein
LVAIVRAVETGHFVFITIPAADKQDGMDSWQKVIDGWTNYSLRKFLGSVVTVM